MVSSWKKILAVFGVRTETITILMILGRIVLFAFLVLVAVGAARLSRSFLLLIREGSDPRLVDWLVPPVVVQVVPFVIFFLVFFFLLSLVYKK